MASVIPTTTKVPGVYSGFDTTSQVSTLPGNNQSVAIIAQKLGSGTAVENKPIEVFSVGDVTTQAGAGSVAELMAKAALSANRNLNLFMVYQNDSGTGAAATGTFVVSGTATANGTVVIYVGAERVEVLVTNTDAATTVAASINTAIGNAQNRIPISGGVSTVTVTATARNKGTIGNDIPLAHDVTNSPGITIATTQMSSGANDPVLQDALDSLSATDVRNIVIQYKDGTNLGTLEQFLRDESEPLQGNRRLGWVGASFVDVATVSTLANNVDYKRVSIGYSRNDKAEPRTKYIEYQIAAAYCATYTKINDTAQPRNGEIIGSMPVPAFDDTLNQNEKQSLLSNGVAALSVIGNDVVITRSVSTKTTTATVEDFTLLDIQITDTLDFAALSLETRLTINYQQSKITQRVKDSIKSTVLSVLYALEILELVRNVADNQDGVIVTENVSNNGQLDLKVPVEVVQGLHIIAQELILIVNPGGNN